MSPASTCSVPNSTTGSGPGMVRRAMFYKPQEPGFYSVAAPAGPGCGHPSRGSPEGPVCHPREHYLTLWNRKGFVCLALRHGAMFCKPPETGFYPVPAPARPGCGHPGWGRTRGPVCPPGEHCLTLWNRKGFVRLALRHGFTQVPMYSFGYLNPDIGPRIDENGAFTVKPPAPDSWQHLFQTTFKQLMYFSPCILWGCGLFSAKS
ncbi:hypothetical protein MJT46_017998 [Ovis ammon polii x Ovis aries]|nr:hypothetical protein MJT46_017998 [Ovis ammon polii x Ovis aries]